MTGSTMPAGDESTGKTYLGDAVYIGRWRGGAVMWTTDGYTETNRIFLEREVISELIRWLARNTTTKTERSVNAPTLPATPTPVPDAEDRRRPWVTTAGVVVGGAYIRPAPQLGTEALRLQVALLGWPRQQRIALRRGLLERIRELLQ